VESIYIELNDDLQHLTLEEHAIDHWMKIGYFEMRLYHRKQLKCVSEFGNQMIWFIPYIYIYIYYLHTNGLLFDNTVTTYHGMRPFYLQIFESTSIETCVSTGKSD
jgi:hypothetical protein